jgi:DNA-binding SARP family transcriptional activator
VGRIERGRDTLHLLGGTRLTTAAGHDVAVPEGSKRLVAFVALHERRVRRSQAAAVLWPGVDRHRAAGNLRSAMWRLRCTGVHVLDADKTWLWLGPDLALDLDEVAGWAGRVVSGTWRPADLRFEPGALQALDLLPGWYDDWVLAEREQLRLMLLGAIEHLSRLLVCAHRCGDAVEAALTVVSSEPLRESAQRALIEAHLAEGNLCEALRSFATYESLLKRELSVPPPRDLTAALIGGC